MTKFATALFALVLGAAVVCWRAGVEISPVGGRGEGSVELRRRGACEAALLASCADRIESGEIKNTVDLKHYFAHARDAADADAFGPQESRLARVTGANWDSHKLSAELRRMAQEFE
jgi:hypothetical protein